MQIEPICINLGHLTVKVRGLICPNLSINIIAGMDWLCQVRPTIDWETSTLTVGWGGINYNVYPDGMHHLFKDYVFVNMVEARETKTLDLENCEFHCI